MNTSSVLPAPRSWLTVGDPGPLPAPVTEPRHAEWCRCDAASSAPVPSEPASSELLSSEPLSSEPLASGPLHWATPGVTPPPAGPSPLLAQLRSALDALAEHGPVSGSRADTATMLQLGEQARALALRELAEMDAVGGHQRPGVTSTTASWLRGEQHLTDGAARAAVGLATALRDDLPALGDLLAHGQVTVEHTAAVVAGVRGLDRDTVRDAEQGLCDLARLTDPVDVRKRLRDKAAAVDDRIARQAARRARERMGLRLNDVGPHTAVDGTLAGDDGATVRLAMALAVEADRQDGDARGKAARQADVLVGWARDYLAHRHGAGDSLADDARTVRTHLHVLCRPEQLAARPCTGTVGARLADLLRRDLAGEPPAAAGIVGDADPLSRGALRRLACDATLDLVALHSRGLHACADSSAGSLCTHLADPLSVGRSTRTVTGRQFRALVVRDGTCVVKGCHRRPAECAAHHVLHWADGGTTDLGNLVLLCHQHHHDHHDRGLDLPHQDGQRWLTELGWRHGPP